MIDPLPTWKSELEAIEPAADPVTAAKNLATWYSERIAGIQPDPTALVASGFVFNFALPIFQSQLLALTPVTTPIEGIKKFADAWEAAMLATVVVVAPGSFIPPTSPPTLFSVVLTTLIDPPSIQLGKLKILELVASPPASSAPDSKFADKFFEATSLLTITVTGLDSTPPPAGPLPLTAPLVPLV